MTIAEFKSTGSNESPFSPEDLAEIRRRKEESRRRMKARIQAAREERGVRRNQLRGQGATGN